MPARAPEPTAQEVLGLMGTAEGRALAAAFVTRGAEAVVELFEAMLRPAAPTTLQAHPADIDADLTELVVGLACAHPDVFTRAVAREPALLERSAVLAAAGQVRGEATDRWVLEALSHSSQFHREQALSILLDRGDARVVPRLRKLLRDRGSTVRFGAADGLRRFGTMDDIPELVRYGERAPRGGAERALDAIESICTRAGAPLPPSHPGARLVELNLEGAASVEARVGAAHRVRAGEVLALVDGEEVRGPRDAVVVALDRDAEGRLCRIVLRVAG